MRGALSAIIILFAAVLGGCMVVLGSLAVQFMHQMRQSPGIGAVAGGVNGIAILTGASLGAVAGFLLTRLFLPRR